jgi:signal peptidase I
MLPRRLRLLWLLVALAGALAVRRWVWMPALITGRSMLPTLLEGQIVGVNKLAYTRHAPARGDIVQIWTGSEFLVKRVVGLPGEEVAIHDGSVYVNAAPLTEPYVEFPDRWREIASGKIDPDCFLVVGDNRSQSTIAIVSRTRIVGRLARRITP